MGMDDLAEIRAGVELACLDRVLDKVDDDVRARLEVALESENTATDEDFVQVVGHDLHAVLAHLTRNPVLELVALVLIRLNRLHMINPSGHRPRQLIDEVTRTHGRIVEAIVGEVHELAQHRMRRHLGALRPFMG